jgi:PEP-CTERM motif
MRMEDRGSNRHSALPRRTESRHVGIGWGEGRGDGLVRSVFGVRCSMFDVPSSRRWTERGQAEGFPQFRNPQSAIRNRLVLSLLLLTVASAPGQGSAPQVLNTGGGTFLVSQSVNLNGTSNPQASLQLDFGFATEEPAQPDVIADSLTITLQTQDGQFTAIYATADPSGVVFAPPTPGTIPIDPTSITAEAMSYPSLTPQLPPALAQFWAYSIVAPIPVQMIGPPLVVYFDLFDNGDQLASQGWYNNVIITVPEPSVYSLALLGGLVGWRLRRRR